MEILELKKMLKNLLGEVNNRLYITEDMLFLELKDSSVEIIKVNIPVCGLSYHSFVIVSFTEQGF